MELNKLQDKIQEAVSCLVIQNSGTRKNYLFLLLFHQNRRMQYSFCKNNNYYFPNSDSQEKII